MAVRGEEKDMHLHPFNANGVNKHRCQDGDRALCLSFALQWRQEEWVDRLLDGFWQAWRTTHLRAMMPPELRAGSYPGHGHSIQWPRLDLGEANSAHGQRN